MYNAKIVQYTVLSLVLCSNFPHVPIGHSEKNGERGGGRLGSKSGKRKEKSGLKGFSYFFPEYPLFFFVINICDLDKHFKGKKMRLEGDVGKNLWKMYVPDRKIH